MKALICHEKLGKIYVVLEKPQGMQNLITKMFW